MTGRQILGIAVTALALFVFGFLYWAMNPLPYAAWNAVEDAAAAQATAQALFPEDGLYVLPGPGNDPEALKLLETGPLVYLAIDHSPSVGGDPAALAQGFVHNLLSALLLFFVFRGLADTGARLRSALLLGVAAVFVINGSEIVWWAQPAGWVVHQAIYYLLYFVIAALVLGPFLGSPEPDAAH